MQFLGSLCRKWQKQATAEVCWKEKERGREKETNLTSKKQSFYACSPGHRAILQGLCCVSGPSHDLPPYWGGTHDLVLVLWPRPHVNEHRLQGDHSSQTPCTVIKQRGFKKKRIQSNKMNSKQVEEMIRGITWPTSKRERTNSNSTSYKYWLMHLREHVLDRRKLSWTLIVKSTYDSRANVMQKKSNLIQCGTYRFEIWT